MAVGTPVTVSLFVPADRQPHGVRPAPRAGAPPRAAAAAPSARAAATAAPRAPRPLRGRVTAAADTCPDDDLAGPAPSGFPYERPGTCSRWEKNYKTTAKTLFIVESDLCRWCRIILM